MGPSPYPDRRGRGPRRDAARALWRVADRGAFAPKVPKCVLLVFPFLPEMFRKTVIRPA